MVHQQDFVHPIIYLLSTFKYFSYGSSLSFDMIIKFLINLLNKFIKIIIYKKLFIYNFKKYLKKL